MLRSNGREGRGDTENLEHNTKCKCPEAETYLVPELQCGGEMVKRQIREDDEDPVTQADGGHCKDFSCYSE